MWTEDQASLKQTQHLPQIIKMGMSILKDIWRKLFVMCQLVGAACWLTASQSALHELHKAARPDSSNYSSLSAARVTSTPTDIS